MNMPGQSVQNEFEAGIRYSIREPDSNAENWVKFISFYDCAIFLKILKDIPGT